MAGIYDVGALRKAAEANGFEGTDEELILETARLNQRDPVDLARYLGYDLGGKWGNRASASIDSYQANMYGLGEALTGADWFRSGRRENEAAAELQRGIARSQGAISSYKDVGGVGDALDYVGGLAVDSLPYAFEALGGGIGAARLAGRGLQATINAGRAADAGVDVVRAGQAAERALALRSTAGGVAASYPSAVGDILSNQREASPDGSVDLMSAFAGGVPYAALNAFGIEGALARRSLARGVGEGGSLARLGRSIGTTALVEGAGETGQEMINQGFGRMAVNPNAGLFDSDALERYGESFVGGAALGGAFGSVGGWRRSQQAADQQRLQSAADGDWQRAQVAIEVAEKQRELDLLNRRPDFELESPQATGLPAPAWNPLADSADWGEGGISGEQYDLFNPNGTPTYAANPDGPMAAVAGVREQLGQAPQLGPGLINELAGVVAPPTPQVRAARAADFTAASNEPGQRYVDADGIEHVGTRGMDYDRQTGVLEEIQRRAAEDRAADDRARVVLGSGAGQKAIGLARRLIALRDAGAIDENQYVDSAALLTNSKFPAVTKFIEAQEQRASQQPVVPGSTGAPGSPVAGQGDQPGRGAGTARPVAGGRVAEPGVDAELADAGGETNPTLVGAGAVGAAGARPTELTDREIEALAQASRPITETRKATVERRNAASAGLDQFLVDAYEKGVAVGSPLTADEMAAVATERGFTNTQGKPISRQAVTERLKANGIQFNDANQTALNLDTVNPSELIGEVTGEDADTTLGGAGFRAAASAADTAQDELGTNGGFSSTVADEDGRPVRDADAAERAAKKAERLSALVGRIINAKTEAQLRKVAAQLRDPKAGFSSDELAQLEKIFAVAEGAVKSGQAKLEDDLGRAKAKLGGEESSEESRQRLIRATREVVQQDLRILSNSDVAQYWAPVASLWDENRSAGHPVFAQLPGAAKLRWMSTLASVDEGSPTELAAAVEEFENELTKVNFSDKAFGPISEAAERSFRAAGAVLRAERRNPALNAVGDRPTDDIGSREEAPADGALPVVGDGTRAQGVKIERKGAKAPKVRDYAHLSGVELTDTIEVDGASTVMRMKADEELKRLDKLEDDLNAIIACVKGIG